MNKDKIRWVLIPEHLATYAVAVINSHLARGGLHREELARGFVDAVHDGAKTVREKR